MNVTDLIQSFFGGEHGAQLGQAAGLDAQAAQNALSTGLPLQLDALADHAGTPEGQSQIAEAVENLPRFGSVHDALAAPDGAMNLQRAGELLAPALLGGRADSIVTAVATQTGAAPAGVGRLLQMALPLLLSLLGQRAGLNPGNVGAVLGGLKGGLGAAGLGAAGLAAGMGMAGGARDPEVTGSAGLPDMGASVPPAPTAPAAATPDSVPAASSMSDGASPAASAGAAPTSTPLTSASLLEFMRGQFSGAPADKIGAAAGFGGSTAGRATQAALPLILNALANRGKTESGAADVLSMARPFSALSDDRGHLNTALLDDTAELSRIEGQGRGLLGSLFGNVDELTGRLGTALGGSGASAGRLLALLTPLVLSVLGGRARAGHLNAGGLSGLLGGLGGGLSGLLPSGLSSLGALLGAGALAGASVAAMSGAATPTSSTSSRLPATAKGTVPGPAAAAPVPPAPAAVTSDRRGGFPLWLIPLLAVLLLGGCWLLRQRPATTTATTGTSGAATTGADTTGTGTTSTGTTDTAGTGTTDTGTAATDPSATTGATDTAGAPGTFAISEPAADAALPAGGFTLRGTGKAGDTLQVLEDGTSLGNVTVGEDGSWSLDVPSPAAGAHTYSVRGADGAELGSVAATIGAADANASAANCTEEYSLSISDGQTVTEPFRFGGKGQGQGYSVTVRRGERTIGTKNVPLDSTCGWSYQSKPGAGAVTYVVRPIGDAAAEPLSTVNVTVSR